MSTETWVITAPQTVRIADVQRLTAQLNDGSVEIVGDAAATCATVEVTEAADRPVQVTCAGGQLRVGYELTGIEGVVDGFRALRDKDRAVLRVTLPISTSVRVTAARAAVTVSGLRADVAVTTGNGAVRMHHVTGSANLKTAAGAVSVTEHTGDLRVSTGSGPMTVAGLLSRVTVATVTGRVEIAASSGQPLIEVRTVSADVAVRLGADAGINLRARSVTGSVAVNGVEVEGSPRSTVIFADTPGAATAFVSSNTVTGDLAVSRA